MSEQKEQQPQQPGQQIDGPAAQASVEASQQEPESVTIDISQNQSSQQQSPPPPGFKTTFNRYKDNLLKRPIQMDPVSIIFAVLILGGGIYGYVSKDSAASLVAGVVFGLLLAFATYFEGARNNPYPLLTLLVFLFVMFAYRYAQAWKFMPSGLFTLLTLIMVLRNCYIIYVKRQQVSAVSS